MVEPSKKPEARASSWLIGGEAWPAWHPESSSVTRFAYHRATRVLLVEFRTGRVYEYQDIPPAFIEEWRGAESAGRFFNEWIRDRFAFRELDEVP